MAKKQSIKNEMSESDIINFMCSHLPNHKVCQAYHKKAVVGNAYREQMIPEINDIMELYKKEFLKQTE